MERAPALKFLPLDLRQLDEFAALVSVRDPFDRLILGACRAVDGQLVTRDEHLQSTGLAQTVWS
jgi:PIN domain nuclease of toxin-antitoxin system